MTGIHDVTPAVRLRSVEDRDLDVFFDHQADPQAVEMAAFPARDKDQFAEHCAKRASAVRSVAARRRAALTNGDPGPRGRTGCGSRNQRGDAIHWSARGTT